MSHTPTPLEFVPGECGHFHHIKDANGINIARLAVRHHAEFIVRCVNSHDRLIEVLEKLRNECTMILNDRDLCWNDLNLSYDVDEAIKLAKGAA